MELVQARGRRIRGRRIRMCRMVGWFWRGGGLVGEGLDVKAFVDDVDVEDVGAGLLDVVGFVLFRGSLFDCLGVVVVAVLQFHPDGVWDAQLVLQFHGEAIVHVAFAFDEFVEE